MGEAAGEAGGQGLGRLADGRGEPRPGLHRVRVAAERDGERGGGVAGVVEGAGRDAGEALGDVAVLDGPAAAGVLGEARGQAEGIVPAGR